MKLITISINLCIHFIVYKYSVRKKKLINNNKKNSYLVFPTTLAGLPETILLDSISVEITLPAPTTTLSPIVTPGNIIEPAPKKQSFPIFIF